MILPEQAFTLSKKLRNALAVIAAFGIFIFITGLFFNPERVWPGFLIAVYYWLSLALGCGFFIATLYVSNAGWAAAIRRIPEAVAATLPWAGIGVIILIFGIHTLYEWSHGSVVAEDKILLEKSSWLNIPFFIVRQTIYLFVWGIFIRLIVMNSRRQDLENNSLFTRKNVRNSTLFLLCGVPLFSLASFDLIMSLQPHWYSTIFGFLNLAGMINSSLAMITILLVYLRSKGYERLFTEAHLATMGTLLMSFSVFWAYMWVSQHMLIWYSNLPEETTYYVFRHFGGWGSLSILNVGLNWLIPFLALLPRQSKRNDKVMLQVSIVMLLGHWLDLFIMVMPATFRQQPTLGVWEIGVFAGIMALMIWLVFIRLGQARLIPVNDPYLIESLPVKEH